MSRFFSAASTLLSTAANNASTSSTNSEYCAEINCAWPVVVLYGVIGCGFLGCIAVTLYLKNRQALALREENPLFNGVNEVAQSQNPILVQVDKLQVIDEDEEKSAYYRPL